MAEERIYRVKVSKEQPPSSWEVEHYANIGMSELFVFRYTTEIPRILNASYVDGEQREEATNKINEFALEGLIPAFEHLRTIRKQSLTKLPEMNRRQMYHDFFRTLWQAYRDGFSKAVKALGFDLPFYFKTDAEFESGAKKHFDADFTDFLMKQRQEWQNDLSRIRNDYLEHRKLGWGDVEHFYCLGAAERFFYGAWTTAEEVLIGLIQSRLPPMSAIVEIPPEKRDPKYPLRFQFVLVG